MDTLVLSTLFANTAALVAIIISLAVAHCWPAKRQIHR